MDNGVQFSLVLGCWGVKPIDFEFTNEMKEKEDGLAHYSKFTGKCMCMHETTQLKVHCNKDLAELLAIKYGEKLTYNEYFKELIITKNKKKSYTLSHISSFITSYMRINMYEQLKNIDATKTLRVNMDGIYYEDHDFVINQTFRDGFKNGVVHIPNNIAGNNYFVSGCVGDANDIFKNTLLIDYNKGYRIEARVGGGGCGKTHNEITNRNDYTSITYTTICKRLLTAKKEEYPNKELNCITIAKLLCGAERKYLKVYPANILNDECTMITNDQKNLLHKLYPYSRIIHIGDIDKNNIIYQLPCVDGERFNIKDIDYINDNFNTMHRCKCPKLRNLLVNVRELIKLAETSNDSDSADYYFNKLIEYCKKMGIVYNAEKIKTLYDINDYIITCKHKNKDSWTELFKGKFDKEKYYVTKNNQFYDNGNIIISDKKPLGSEIRHAFTIHSIQGQTCKTKLFIDLRNYFGGLQMIYTALSRAEYLNNVFIIL